MIHHIIMEVDLKNNELPTGRITSTCQQMDRLLGLRIGSVQDSITYHKKIGKPCRFVRVELEDSQCLE